MEDQITITYQATTSLITRAIDPDITSIDPVSTGRTRVMDITTEFVMDMTTLDYWEEKCRKLRRTMLECKLKNIFNN